MTNKEIKCPNCGTVIQIDESTYDSIAKQIRNEEFSNELAKQREDAVKLAKAEAESNFKDKISEKDDKIIELEKKYQELRTKASVEFNKKDADYNIALAQKEKEISELQSKLSNQELVSKNEVTKALAEADKKIASLETELKDKEEKFQSYLDKVNADNGMELIKKEGELSSLQAKLNAKDAEKELELSKVEAKNKEEINNLNNQIQVLNEQYKSKEEALKSNYEFQLKAANEQVEMYKNFKAKQSTKGIGEDLEHYCENQFNKTLRPVFPYCYFEKDNVVSKDTGSKGDFIFKDYDAEKAEIVSVMIECKNEADDTEKKHKNEDFFKELDKDRKEKECEYAVLVSTLEADSDLYNEGIVDVSYRYEKMYVVRPQQLIPLLTLLRNSSMKALDYKKELIIAQNTNLDIAHFEENMNTFKVAFGKNYDLASRKFKDAISEIDKSIDHLQKIKDNLLSSENNLRLANNKAQDLSIKKLTNGAPSVAEKFEELKENSEE